MNRFAALVATLEQATGSAPKVAAVAAYIVEAGPEDRVWAIALLSGRRPKRSMTAACLLDWALEQAGMPRWLFDECRAVAGDLPETLALVLSPAMDIDDRPLSLWLDLIGGLGELDAGARKQAVCEAWGRLSHEGRFLFNKLVTGGFRTVVSQKVMTRALARATGRGEAGLAHRLMSDWSPGVDCFDDVFLTDDDAARLSRPYPLHPIRPMDRPEPLGAPADWRAEYKWEGLRGQLILRQGQAHLWSGEGELITSAFPEFVIVPGMVPRDLVLDGEILAWQGGVDGAPLPYGALQQRIGRKSASAAQRRKAPVIFKAADLLEDDGTDIRALAYDERRARLGAVMAQLPPGAPVQLSERVPFQTWRDIAAVHAGARGRGVEGVMLKSAASPYLSEATAADCGNGRSPRSPFMRC